MSRRTKLVKLEEFVCSIEFAQLRLGGLAVGAVAL